MCKFTLFILSLKLKSFSKQVSTGNLNRHLINDHNIRCDDDPATTSLTKYFSSSQLPKQEKSNKEKKWILGRELVLWIARDLLPFNIVKHEGFKDFFKKYSVIGNEDDLPHPNTLATTALDDVYGTLLSVVKKQILGHEHFSLTFDMWIDNYKKKSYITFTFHFIDEKFKLKSLTLETKHVPHTHTSENILHEIEKVEEMFNISINKNFVVTDQGSNIKKAIGLGNFNNHFCVGHAFHNLLTVDGIDSIEKLKEIIFKVKKIVRSLRFKTTQLEKVADNIQKDILSKINNLEEILASEDNEWEDDEGFSPIDDVPISTLSKINDINNIKESLIEKQYRSLKNSTPTRWHSVLPLLDSVCCQRSAINTLLEKNNKFNLILSVKEADILINLKQFLQKFKDAVNCLSGSKYASLSLCILMRNEIEAIIEYDDDDHPLIAELKHNLKLRLDYRFPITDVIITASLLDPRCYNLNSVNNYLNQKKITKNEFLKKQYDLLVSTSENHVDILVQPSSSKIVELAKKHSSATMLNNLETECHNLFSMPSDNDVLEFWKDKQSIMPGLTNLARKILCIPATSTPSERVFSIAGLTITSKRSQISPHNVDKLIFIHDNYEYFKECLNNY